MSLINITNIELLNNPATFNSPLGFQVTFECLKDLPDEIEWKIIYVGSSKDEKYDQLLDSFTMGPIQFGVMQFDIESNPPNPSLIPKEEILGVTAIILSVSYHEQEFFRVGYYVYNTYTDQELIDNPPEEPQIDKINRNILQDKPRITRFEIKWGDEKEEENTSTQDNSSAENQPIHTTHMEMFGNDNNQFAKHANPFLSGNSDEIQCEEYNARDILGGMENNNFLNSHEPKNSVF